jgi:L-threonylcarbamoyladenylate synthase
VLRRESVSKVIVRNPDRLAIKDAADLLRRGQLVAFPTETVYGLGADAQNDAAIERLYRAKGRPSNHPVIVHLASKDQLGSWCAGLPEEAEILASKFWPGPLTLVLKRSAKAKDSITGGQDTVALRIPSNEIALALLTEFGDGLIAPSANKFGSVSSTLAEHVIKEFGDEIPLVLDGGLCQVGIESTIVNLSGDQIEILRPGMISAEQIAQCLGISDPSELITRKSKVRVSGDLPRHYAPSTPLKVVSKQEIESLLKESASSYAVISFGQRIDSKSVRKWVTLGQDPAEFARSLYANLRTLDAIGAEVILVEAVPDTIAWAAVKDRLKRAGEPNAT